MVKYKFLVCLCVRIWENGSQMRKNGEMSTVLESSLCTTLYFQINNTLDFFLDSLFLLTLHPEHE